MNNRVEYLREQATTDCVAYTEFMLQYKKGENVLYCFFEGYEDRTFYSIRIENISSTQGYNDFICGGKEGVLKVHSLIKESPHYKDVKTGFFVDSDYDNFAIPDGVYVTPTYSIENLYCCQESFEKILLSEFKMKKTDKDFERCVSNYIDLQKKFNNETLLLNSWLACQADYRNKNKITTRLKIDKTVKAHFDKIVLPDLTDVRHMAEISSKEKLQIIFNDAPIIDDKELSNKISEFKIINQTEKFRGKFLLRFLESYLSRLQSIFGMDCSPFEKKYSCKLRIEYTNLCSNLSQYAKTTACLKEYVKNR
jgi:hypothetical protein